MSGLKVMRLKIVLTKISLVFWRGDKSFMRAAATLNNNSQRTSTTGGVLNIVMSMSVCLSV